MENKSPFQVLRGGLSDSARTSRKEFLSAYITDTRLMGVVGVYVHWLLPENTVMKHFHQFFYLDSEDLGFDTYESVLAEDEIDQYYEIKTIENRLMGGLGGQKKEITEKEVRWLVQEYVKQNLRMKVPLPENFGEYEFLLSPIVQMSEEEEYLLMCKQCTPLPTPEFVINYFLMRCFGRDFIAAKFLTKHYVRTDLFSEHKGATLMANTIDEASDAVSGTNAAYHVTDDDKDFGTFSTHKAYMCRSLIEYDSKYFLIVTQVTLDKLKVVKYERISSFQITATEASMMTSKPEFITLFDFMGEGKEFENDATKLTAKAMVTDHDSGRILMIFHPHNNHVGKREYRLSDDVIGLYYILDDGQIILSANDRPSIELLEQDLLTSRYGSLVVPIAKYQFKEPVLYDFISSGFDDFEEYVELISEKDEDE